MVGGGPHSTVKRRLRHAQSFTCSSRSQHALALRRWDLLLALSTVAPAAYQHKPACFLG